MPTQVLLYHTEFCHLCDEAKALLGPICDRLGVGLREVDIAGDETLEGPYATRIPVLRRPDSGAELGWPFDSAEAYRFLL